MVNTELQKMFQSFLASGDPQFYLDGIAGCGKSTQVAIGLLPVYRSLFPLDTIKVIAPTHAAKGELMAKIDYLDESDFHTMHSYVGMAPETEQGAVDLKFLQRNRRVREAMQADLLVIDEAGMADEDCAGIVLTLLKTGDVKRLLMLGDEHQLLPIKGKQLLAAPKGAKWHYVIEINYRARAIPDVQHHVYDLYNRMKEGVGHKLRRFLPEESDNLTYVEEVPRFDVTQDRALAFTNRAVQNLNQMITGNDRAVEDEIIFSASTKNYYRIERVLNGSRAVMHTVTKPRGKTISSANDTFRTREFIGDLIEDYAEGLALLKVQVVEAKAGEWVDVDDGDQIIFAQYGTARYKDNLRAFRDSAIETNKVIAETYPRLFEKLAADKVGEAVVNWRKGNYTDPLAKKSTRAWRTFLAFDEAVHCVDAPFCTTIHAAQGATHRNTYIDLDDIKMAQTQGGDLFTRLLYVAISRATGGLYVIR